jgi:hypothetical protein
MAQPGSGSITVSIPAGWKITQVTNLDTRLAVSYTSARSQITFALSDDPIEVMVVPM